MRAERRVPCRRRADTEWKRLQRSRSKKPRTTHCFPIPYFWGAQRFKGLKLSIGLLEKEPEPKQVHRQLYGRTKAQFVCGLDRFPCSPCTFLVNSQRRQGAEESLRKSKHCPSPQRADLSLAGAARCRWRRSKMSVRMPRAVWVFPATMLWRGAVAFWDLLIDVETYSALVGESLRHSLNLASHGMVRVDQGQEPS